MNSYEFTSPFYFNVKRTYCEEINLISSEYFSTENHSEDCTPNDVASGYNHAVVPKNEYTTESDSVKKQTVELNEWHVNELFNLGTVSAGRNSPNLVLLRPDTVNTEENKTSSELIQGLSEESIFDVDLIFLHDHCYSAKFPTSKTFLEEPSYLNSQKQAFDIDQSHIINFNMEDINMIASTVIETSNAYVEQENMGRDDVLSQINVRDFEVLHDHDMAKINESIFLEEDYSNPFNETTTTNDDTDYTPSKYLQSTQICPDAFMTISVESGPDQRVPDMFSNQAPAKVDLDSEKEFYKLGHIDESVENQQKPIRIGLSKKQRVTPLHVFNL